MVARSGTAVLNDEEYRRIQEQLNDWGWQGTPGRPRKEMPAFIARDVLRDVVVIGNLSAVQRKYNDVFPFSRRWLRRVLDNGRLKEMAGV